MENAKPAALIFDCDGVLVDSEAISMAVDLEKLSHFGLNYSLDEYSSQLIGLNDHDYVSRLKRDYHTLGKGELPLNILEAMKRARWERYSLELRSFEGLPEILDVFDGKVAVATSSTADSTVHKLQLTGLYKYFQGRIYSTEEVSSGKPAPDIFQHIMRRMGLTPSQCLVIEDSVNGVNAALRAGIRVWGFTGGGHADKKLAERLESAGAEKVFSNYTELGYALR